MVRLTVLSGSRAGASLWIGKFPCSLGREPGADERFEDAGVWEGHAVLERDEAEGFRVTASREGLVVVNGEAVTRALLRSGDLLELGSVRLRFGLAETRQRSFRAREWATWAAVAALCLGQILLVYLVLP